MRIDEKTKNKTKEHCNIRENGRLRVRPSKETSLVRRIDAVELWKKKQAERHLEEQEGACMMKRSDAERDRERDEK